MYEVESKVLSETPTVVLKGKVAVAEFPDFLGRAYEASAAYALKAGVPMVGPPFGRYRAISDEEFDVEAGFPVAFAVEGDDHVAAGSLPAGPAAITWHIGPYDRVGEAYEALGKWIDENGGVPDGAGWEIYYSDPGTTQPAEYRTQVVMPYTTE